MKTAIVTGAAGGMGRAAAEKLTGEGFRVFGLDIRVPEENPVFTFIQTDLTDGASVENAFHAMSEKAERIDCIINMAGVYDLNSLVEMNEEDFTRIFQVNLFAAYRVNKTFLPLLSKGGRIVIVSSELAPLDPLPFTGIYGITKAALEKYAFSLRMELQLLGHPVIVLRPGAVDTGLLAASTHRLECFSKNTVLYACNADRFQRIVSRVEERKISPEKIASVLYRAISAKHPKYVYKINRNPLLLLLNALPDRWQYAIIRRILT